VRGGSTRDAKGRDAPEATEEDTPKGPASSITSGQSKHGCLFNAIAIPGKDTHTHTHTHTHPPLLGPKFKVTAEKVITLATMENLK